MKHTKQNCPNPDSEKKKKADLAEAAWRKRKQQSGAETKVEATGTMLVKETSKTSAVLPAQPTGYLLNYLNQAEKMFLVKETDDTESTMTKADFLGELERRDLEKEALVGNINQDEKIISMKETDAIEGNSTKVDLFRELE